MVRRKIKKKTPDDKIKHKTPASQIRAKTPASKSEEEKPRESQEKRESFILPPPRRTTKSRISKSEIHLPTGLGLRDSTDSKINIPPPVDSQKKQLPDSSKKPKKSRLKHRKEKFSSVSPPKSSIKPKNQLTTLSSKGTVEKGVRKKTPKDKLPPKEIVSKAPAKSRLPPSTKGIGKDKGRKAVNQKVPKDIRSKTPAKSRLPPPTKGIGKDKRKKSKGQTLPPKIISKTPSSIKKKKPPPTIDDSTPKTRIKKKKPR